MIFSNLNCPDSWGALESGVKEALDYAASHNLAALAPGSYPIDGDRLFVNIVEYETKKPEERFWEAHRAYLDVHVSLDGTEQIDLNFLPNLEVKNYIEKDDFVPADGDKACSVIMNPSDFLVCYPADAHRTAVAFEGRAQKVKKAIFKVRI